MRPASHLVHPSDGTASVRTASVRMPATELREQLDCHAGLHRTSMQFDMDNHVSAPGSDLLRRGVHRLDTGRAVLSSPEPLTTCMPISRAASWAATIAWSSSPTAPVVTSRPDESRSVSSLVSDRSGTSSKSRSATPPGLAIDLLQLLGVARPGRDLGRWPTGHGRRWTGSVTTSQTVSTVARNRPWRIRP